MNVKEISLLVGKTFSKVYKIEDRALIFEMNDGSKVQIYHAQDCCESVYLEDICGELKDLVGSPILVAEERCFDGRDAEGIALSNKYPQNGEDYYIWTFYEIKTIKGCVTLRWYGSTSSQYSVSVDVVFVPKEMEANKHTKIYEVGSY